MPTTTVEKIKKPETSESKKDELLLDSLEITGYRCFEHLTIEKLGQVNLIVGKNNVGKTALLEALWFYSRRGFSEFLLDNLYSRKEIKRSIGSSDDPIEINERLKLLKHLFFGRPEIDSEPSIKIGKLSNDSSNLTVRLELHEEAHLTYRDDRDRNKDKNILRNGKFLFFVRYVLGEKFYSNPLNSYMNLIFNYESMSESDFIKCQFVQTKGNIHNSDEQLWDNIVLTTLETELTEALKIIQPNIQRIAFTGESLGGDGRVAFASFSNLSERFSLSSLGEGMTRLLKISLALTNSQNGILLIDEIESGLHYSVLPDVWKLIFKTAKDLNVQVFATTHSKDCVEAFAQAAYDSPEDGMLIRLERQGEKIIAKTIEEEMLVDAVNYEVEVR